MVVVVVVLQLVETENVRGVITMNEDYETRYLCNSAEVRSLHLSSADWFSRELC